jgi:hypothetical protein
VVLDDKRFYWLIFGIEYCRFLRFGQLMGGGPSVMQRELFVGEASWGSIRMGRKGEAGGFAMQKSRLYWMMWYSIFR